MEYTPVLGRYIYGFGATRLPAVVAEWIVVSVTAYLAAGLLFAAIFLTRGIGKVDPRAASPGAAVRLILLPGTLVFWPLLLNRWARGAAVPVERSAHRDLAEGAPSK